MLQKVKMSQFSGIQTETDSQNQGISAAREVRNLFLRPLGALSVPAAWNSFSPGGTALDLRIITTVFNGGRLLIQSPDGSWWDCTATAATLGLITPTKVAAPSAAAQAFDFLVISPDTIGFKIDATHITELWVDQDTGIWYLTGHDATFPPSITTDIAFSFASGFALKIRDSSGNTWKFFMTNDGNLQVITV